MTSVPGVKAVITPQGCWLAGGEELVQVGMDWKMPIAPVGFKFVGSKWFV
jgi:hypothetical protein